MKEIKKIFQDQDAFDKKYEEYMELDELAPKEIGAAYNNITNALNEYIDALMEWNFRVMYTMGYRDALKDNNISK